MKNQNYHPTKQAATPQTISVEAYSGAIPPPEHLRQIESILPGATDRLITMAEKEQNKSHEVVDMNFKFMQKEQSNFYFYNNLILLSGVILTLAFLCVSVYLIISGFSMTGISLIFANIAGVVGATVYGNKKKRK